jgi:hypothetical protein
VRPIGIGVAHGRAPDTDDIAVGEPAIALDA